jgi:hypothetical protein
MDINASAVGAQLAQARANASLGFVKDSAQTDAQIANVVAEAAESGNAAATSGKGSLVDITV